MASEKAENYTNELCTKCPDKMYCHKKCQEYKYSCEVFDAGAESERRKYEWHKCEPFNYPKLEHDVLIKENITVSGKDIDIITVARIDGCADYWYSYNPENGEVIYHYPFEWREIE